MKEDWGRAAGGTVSRDSSHLFYPTKKKEHGLHFQRRETRVRTTFRPTLSL
jgi:hypothetical protein